MIFSKSDKVIQIKYKTCVISLKQLQLNNHNTEVRTVLCQLPINQSSLIIKNVFTWFLVHITAISQSMFCSVGLGPAIILSFLAKIFCNISQWVGVTERGSRLTLQMKYLPDQSQHFRVFLVLNFIIRDERSFHLSTKKPNYVSYTFHQNIYRSSLPVGIYFITFSRISTKWKQIEKQLTIFHLLQGLTNRAEQKQKSNSTRTLSPTSQI